MGVLETEKESATYNRQFEKYYDTDESQNPSLHITMCLGRIPAFIWLTATAVCRICLFCFSSKKEQWSEIINFDG